MFFLNCRKCCRSAALFHDPPAVTNPRISLILPADCHLIIPVPAPQNNRRKRPLVSYELQTCVGSELRVTCAPSCGDRGVAWRREGQRSVQGRDLRLKEVGRGDDGAYNCEHTDFFGKTRVVAVVVVVVQCEYWWTLVLYLSLY